MATWTKTRYGTMILSGLTIAGTLWFNRPDNPKIKPVDWYNLWMGANERIYSCEIQYGDTQGGYHCGSTNLLLTNDVIEYELTTDPAYWISNQIQTNASGVITNVIPHSNLYYVVSGTGEVVETLSGYVDKITPTLQNIYYSPPLLHDEGVPWYQATNTFVPNHSLRWYSQVYTNADGSTRTNAAGDWIVAGSAIQTNQTIVNTISHKIPSPMYDAVSTHILGMLLTNDESFDDYEPIFFDTLWVDYSQANGSGQFLGLTTFSNIIYFSTQMWAAAGNTGAVEWVQTAPEYSTNAFQRRWNALHEMKWRMYVGYDIAPDDPDKIGIGFLMVGPDDNDSHWFGWSTNSLSEALSNAAADTPDVTRDSDGLPRSRMSISQVFDSSDGSYMWRVNVDVRFNYLWLQGVNTNLTKEVDFYMMPNGYNQFDPMGSGYESNIWEFISTAVTNHDSSVISEQIGLIDYPTFIIPSPPSATNFFYSAGWKVNYDEPGEAGGVVGIIKYDYEFITNSL